MPSTLRHGYARGGQVHPVHSVWRAMLQRCSNPNDVRYPKYGGRGIVVCERWKTFENFIADMGEPPPGKSPGGRALYSLDRKDNDKGYGPENCRWSTRQEQANNTTTNRRIEHAGETLTMAQWARRAGITPMAFGRRLGLGWSMDRALTEPLRIRPRRARS